MIVTGVQDHEIEQIVTAISAKQYDYNIELKSLNQVSRNRCTFTIRAVNSRGAGARRSWSGRRMPTACWHAHWDVLARLFAEYPQARVQTAMATYTADTFEDRARATAYVNVGSMMAPAYMPDLCECVGHVSGE